MVMLKMSLRNFVSFVCKIQFQNSIRSAHVIADGRGRCYEHVDSSLKLNYENSESEMPFEKLNWSTSTKYLFPKISLQYYTEDCAEHAASGNLYLIYFSNTF